MFEHIFVWRLEDIFALVCMVVFLITLIIVWTGLKMDQFKKWICKKKKE